MPDPRSFRETPDRQLGVLVVRGLVWIGPAQPLDSEPSEERLLNSYYAVVRAGRTRQTAGHPENHRTQRKEDDREATIARHEADDSGGETAQREGEKPRG
jgi:hypothetical protein